ncbi:hypothetical protein GLYMA_12G139800v4 [Glycine max]|nr:hypothetical protein GLYMA_12G139800v4 [Glycine max]KAH1143089.1 hypothetical protein GYH30_033680 [Glycine max]
MGGGGAMRSAAKIAGIGISKAALRPSALPTEQAVHNASRPTSVVGVKGAKSTEVAPLHAAAPWDDWDLADDGDLVVPRMVFGSVPTFAEAKEATAELKDAIDQVYLSPESSQYSSRGGQVSALSPTGGQVSALSPTLYEPVNRSCVVDAISDSSAPKHAIQAFHLLSTSREAQAVVASLACDPNVWNAVMENPAVSSFFQSQQSVVLQWLILEQQEILRNWISSQVVLLKQLNPLKNWECQLSLTREMGFSISWIFYRM